MRKICLLLMLLLTSVPAFADKLIGSYVARLGASDHFNSKGARLTSPALIIRQDRANFYKFGRGDEEDEDDKFFRDAQNREILQELLERGRTTPEAYRAIVNSQPLVRVNVYRTRSGDYVDVLVLDK
jgi:hypothetical protein